MNERILSMNEKSEIAEKENTNDKESGTEISKKGLPKIAYFAIGCLGLLVISGIILSFVSKILFSTILKNVVQKGIESRTGIKVETDKDSSNISLTDPKTGAKINIGNTAIPADFPKDFPIYPNAKPNGNLSTGGSNQEKGIWLLLSTDDDVKKVTDFYSSNLKNNGWEISNTLTVGDTVTWNCSKNGLSGNMAISKGQDNKTAVMITLSQK